MDTAVVVKEFEEGCRQRGIDFEALDAPGTERVQVRFSGEFHQAPVIWKAQIMTLNWYRRQCQSQTPHPSGRRNFIEVGAAEGAQRRIRIGLQTAQIDVPTIRKTMIMIRQWKNLDDGVHEFGEADTSAP